LKISLNDALKIKPCGILQGFIFNASFKKELHSTVRHCPIILHFYLVIDGRQREVTRGTAEHSTTRGPTTFTMSSYTTTEH